MSKELEALSKILLILETSKRLFEDIFVSELTPIEQILKSINNAIKSIPLIENALKEKVILEKNVKRQIKTIAYYQNLALEGKLERDKKLIVLEIIKELFDFDFAIRFGNNQPMLKIINKRTNEYWELPIPKDKYYILKEVLIDG